MARYHLLAAMCGLVLGSTASATTLFPQKFTCPVGGEEFEAMVIGSHTSWGQRPDGRRYGTSPIIPLTECPKNGFVYFKEKFSEEETERLTPLVLSPAYQAIRSTETPHFRGWWLMSRTEQDQFDTVWMLLVASWESDGDPVRKSRYQTAYVDGVRNLPWSEEKRSDWFWMNLRAANALRELGSFDESLKLLLALDGKEKLPLAADEQKGARFLIDGLKTLNDEKNAAPEPVTLIPQREAAYRCLDATPVLSPSEEKICQSDEVAKLKTEIQKYRRDRN